MSYNFVIKQFPRFSQISVCCLVCQFRYITALLSELTIKQGATTVLVCL